MNVYKQILLLAERVLLTVTQRNTLCTQCTLQYTVYAIHANSCKDSLYFQNLHEFCSVHRTTARKTKNYKCCISFYQVHGIKRNYPLAPIQLRKNVICAVVTKILYRIEDGLCNRKIEMGSFFD